MTTDSIPASPQRSGRSLAFKFSIAFLAGVVLVVGIGAAGLYAYGQQYNGKVLPGVRAGGVDLSGLTPEAATAAIAGAYGELGAGIITLMGPEGELTIGYNEIGRGPDTRAMLDAALAAGRQGEPVADLLGAPQTAIKGVSLDASVTYDPARLEAAVADAAATIDREPVDATLTVAEDGSYSTTESIPGRIVDQQALLANLDDQLSRLDAPGELRIDIPFTTGTPATETADVENAVDAADRMATDMVFTRGKSSWTIPGEKLRPLISFSKTADGGVVPVVDEEGIDPLIKPISKAVNQAATNAGFRVSGSRIVVGSKSKQGRKLDLAATHEVVVDTLMARQGGATDGVLEPVVVASDPAVTSAQAKAIASKMVALPTGKWTTWFQIYERNGFGANIWIPAKLINGYVVGPGETFDFWKAVGPVTRAKGYRDGGAIINGRTEPMGALAGGICSCSTTLFNAALRAGYKMGARRNHYYYIERYPVGLDATVFISGGGSKQTMSFVNDTKYPVLIRGINTRKGNIGYVTFRLYSVPIGRKVVIGAPVIKNRRTASDSVQLTSSLRAGQSRRVEYPVNGFDVWRTVTVYENGKVLRKKTYFSHYAAITGILLRGKGTVPKPDPPPTPTPTPTPTPAP
ncbi:MAG TPA: VanW family protein [Candidatus Limnocylindrales bacterium]|nr:VanW family protein [Candidatus Limnocylindrales bacterium]